MSTLSYVFPGHSAFSELIPHFYISIFSIFHIDSSPTSCFILCFTNLPLSCLSLLPPSPRLDLIQWRLLSEWYRTGRLETRKIYFSVSGDWEVHIKVQDLYLLRACFLSYGSQIFHHSLERLMRDPCSLSCQDIDPISEFTLFIS